MEEYCLLTPTQNSSLRSHLHANVVKHGPPRGQGGEPCLQLQGAQASEPLHAPEHLPYRWLLVLRSIMRKGLKTIRNGLWRRGTRQHPHCLQQFLHRQLCVPKRLRKTCFPEKVGLQKPPLKSGITLNLCLCCVCPFIQRMALGRKSVTHTATPLCHQTNPIGTVHL
jgi:hypothetical protein